MCKLKSGLLFKSGVFVPDYDSHDKMLKEKGIADTAENRIAGKYVRFELSPVNGDLFSPVDTWVFTIDQDELPEWLTSDPGKYEEIARQAVKEWVKAHIFVGADGLEISSGSGYYLKDCKNVVLSGNSQVKVLAGSSTVQNMQDNSTVQDMWDNSTVQDMQDNSTVQNMRDSSTVQDMLGSSTVQDMRDSSTVRIAEYYSKGVNVKTISLSHNATIKDCRTKTLYAAPGWKLSIKEASDA